MKAIRLFSAGLLLTSALLRAQSTFEIASIKPTPPDARCGMIQPMPGGGLKIECVSLKVILTWAYDVRDFEISGGPSWINSVRWDILAKTDRSAAAAGEPNAFEKMNDAQQKRAQEETRQRLQALLADRFQLSIHRESKDLPVYFLTVAKNGFKLPDTGDGVTGYLKRGRGQITGKGAQISTLANFLAIDLGQPVKDRTGLTGHYDFQLTWTPDLPASLEKPGAAPVAPEAAGPSLFTAIQEQLGLRLESHKGPVEILIIDRVEKASEN